MPHTILDKKRHWEPRDGVWRAGEVRGNVCKMPDAGKGFEEIGEGLKDACLRHRLLPNSGRGIRDSNKLCVTGRIKGSIQRRHKSRSKSRHVTFPRSQVRSYVPSSSDIQGFIDPYWKGTAPLFFSAKIQPKKRRRSSNEHFISVPTTTKAPSLPCPVFLIKGWHSEPSTSSTAPPQAQVRIVEFVAVGFRAMAYGYGLWLWPMTS